MDNSIELFNTFESDNQLKPDFEKSIFHNLHSWDLGWAILEPINIAADKEEEKTLSKRFSPGQKLLYFFWYLDAEVTNGGFIQFYWNGNRPYLSPILDGLNLIGDQELMNLLKVVDLEYLTNKDKFPSDQNKEDGLESLYDDLKSFDGFDTQYYKVHERTMVLIEKYIRDNPDDFVNLK